MVKKGPDEDPTEDTAHEAAPLDGDTGPAAALPDGEEVPLELPTERVWFTGLPLLSHL